MATCELYGYGHSVIDAVMSLMASTKFHLGISLLMYNEIHDYYFYETSNESYIILVNILVKNNMFSASVITNDPIQRNNLPGYAGCGGVSSVCRASSSRVN